MTDINKNFGLAGVGSDVQFGKGGARLLYSGGVFVVKDPSASALVRLQVANASTNSDAVPKGQLDLAALALQSEIDAIETSVGLNTNGTLPAWSSPIYIGNSTTLVNAVSVLDQRMKLTADNIAAIGNAFNYVTGVTGGGTSGTAFDLATLGSQDPGDYYKVTTSGYFKVGSGGTPFVANINDGLVKNTTGSWDIIDNTNSTVSGTSGRIVVTGTADTGFTINLDTSYVGQNSITTVGTITSGVWQGNAITASRGGTGQTTYSTGDLLVGSSGSLVRLAMGPATYVLRVNSAGTGLEYAPAADVNITNLLTATQAGAGLLSNGAYSANTSAHYISTAGNLTQADNILDYRVFLLNGNVATVASGLGTTTSLLTATQSGAGLAANGAYVPNLTTTYLTTANSLVRADTLLDLAVSNLSNTVTGLSSNQGANSVLLTAIRNSAGLAVNGAYVANASSHFIYGANSLFNADNLLDQAIYNLTTTVNNLSPDQIISTDQKVSVKAQTTGAEISGNVGGTKTMLMDFRSGSSTNVTLRMDYTQAGRIMLRAQGATNADIVLAPNGSGVIDGSGTRVANVANAFADSDAVALGQANSIFARYMTNTFAETNSIQTMGSVNGIIMRVIVLISAAFNSGATVTIGYSSSQSAIASVSEIDLSVPGIYVIERVAQINQTINAYVSGATGSGAGRVIVEYLKV